jgi:hypothetical protein
MKLAQVRDWLEVVGLFAVVLFLIFVGWEAKQARDIALTVFFVWPSASWVILTARFDTFRLRRNVVAGVRRTATPRRGESARSNHA